MAVTRGCRGVVRAKLVGASGAAAAIGELTDWSFSETAEELDASAMGACSTKAEAGAVKSNADVSAWWDQDDSVQGIFAVGSKFVLEIYPEGTASGSNYYKTSTAGATLLNHAVQGNGVNGLVARSMTFGVNGSMTATSV